jgi:tetratricopeptide (TPR) repeat protein
MHHLWAIALDWICWLLVLVLGGAIGFWVYERSDDRRALVRRWIISAFLILIMIAIPIRKVPFLIILPYLILAFLWIPSLTNLLLKPLTGAFDGGMDHDTGPKPFYFLAEGQRRKGLYQEAIVEVRKQLEIFPGDFEGFIKLASIQMEDLKDFPAAEATLNECLAEPGRTPQNVVSALHLLADWQLQHARDARGARGALERIVQLYPGTPFAHAAEQRIARLGSADETRRVREESRFQVGTRERGIGLRKEAVAVPMAPVDPNTLAEEYGKQLELHPSDTATREKLAVLYGEEFGRIDLAAVQLEQLIALPAESSKHVAHWLNLLATLHIRIANDVPAAENALRRIIGRFPEGALASVAERRLATLKGELKGSQTTVSKALPKAV